MAANANLHKAKDAKNDEFYTQFTDVSKELTHYKQYFKNNIGIYYKYKSWTKNIIKLLDGLKTCVPAFNAKFKYDENSEYTEELEFEN